MQDPFPSYICNYHNLLIRECDVSNIGREVGIKEAKFCHNHYVIVKFIRSKPHLNIVDWVVDVNKKVQTIKISLKMDLSRGFFMFKTNAPLPTKKGPHVYPPQGRLGNVHLP
jgi:hypothetical protein